MSAETMPPTAKPDEAPPFEFFVAEGTLRSDAPSYVKRPADDELFAAALAGKFCYVLTPRQMGKSSLMVQTARRLRAAGVQAANIDLTAIGARVTPEQWYLGFLMRLNQQLRLRFDVRTWWAEQAMLGPVQRFTDFLREVVLAQIEAPVVILVDEIDTTLNLDFSDDFFAAVRSVYNERAENPAYKRLTFIFFGVATPSDLIDDRRRTPFNVGQALNLDEFTRPEAGVLAEGLRWRYPDQGKRLFDRIFYWTGGHPYLTQKLCLQVAEADNTHWSVAAIDRLVAETFLLDTARDESNIKFVSDRILTHPQKNDLLKLYRQIYRGKTVMDDGKSPLHSQLKLSGLVKVENGRLHVRNEIYRRAFNSDWIRKHTAVNWQIFLIVMLSLIIIIGSAAFVYNNSWLRSQADDAELAFTRTGSGQERATALLKIFKLRPLFGPNYDRQALDLFFDLDSWQEQTAIYTEANFENEEDLALLVEHMYVTLAHADETDDNTAMLENMLEALNEKTGVDTATRLKREIEFWVEGRKFSQVKDYVNALDQYNQAIVLNNLNPATLLERSRILIQLGNYEAVARDLDQIIAIALQQPESEENIGTTRTVTPTSLPAGTTTRQTPTEPNTTTITSEPNTLGTIPLTLTLIVTPTSTDEAAAVSTVTDDAANLSNEISPKRIPIHSNFKTRGQIIGEVRDLINENPSLTIVLVNSDASEFLNLRNSGIIPDTLPKLADLVISEPMLISTPPIVGQQPVDFRFTITNTSEVPVEGGLFVDIFFSDQEIIDNGLPIADSNGYRGISSFGNGDSQIITITSPLGFTSSASEQYVYGFVDSLQELQEINESNNISDGVLIAITPAASSNPNLSVDPVVFIEYIVQPSDSLFSISERTDVSNALLTRYNISQEDLIPNTTISLPVGNPAYCPNQISYAVEEGDTAFSIATRFNITVDMLIAINKLVDSNSISAGATILCIPSGQNTLSPTEMPATAVSSETPTPVDTSLDAVNQTATPAPLPTPTSTPIPEGLAVAKENAGIFVFPDGSSDRSSLIPKGETATVLGRSAIGGWLYVRYTKNNITVTGFAFADLLEYPGIITSLSIVPNPTLTPTPGGVLTIDLWPLPDVIRCEGGFWFQQVFIEGHGGDGNYTYRWEGVYLAGPLARESHIFEVNGQIGQRIAGTGLVTSGNGQSAQKEIIIEPVNCGG